MERHTGVLRSASVAVIYDDHNAQEMMMTKIKLAGAMLSAVVAIGIVGGGVTAATAQTGSPMGKMQIAPGSKMDMRGKKMSSKKPAHHKKTMRHHKAAAK